MGELVVFGCPDPGLARFKQAGRLSVLTGLKVGSRSVRLTGSKNRCFSLPVVFGIDSFAETNDRVPLCDFGQARDGICAGTKRKESISQRRDMSGDGGTLAVEGEKGVERERERAGRYQFECQWQFAWRTGPWSVSLCTNKEKARKKEG